MWNKIKYSWGQIMRSICQDVFTGNKMKHYKRIRDTVMSFRSLKQVKVHFVSGNTFWELKKTLQFK